MGEQAIGLPGADEPLRGAQSPGSSLQSRGRRCDALK
jgi:hypothetical protein